jgi:hypothetical protein
VTPFDRLDRAAMATLEQVYGEPFEHRPRARPSGSADVNARSSIADASRPIRTVTAIYTDRPIADGRMSDLYDPRADQRPGITAREHVIEIDPRVFDIDVRTDDTFVRVSDGKRFSVLATNVTDTGRLICAVNVL